MTMERDELAESTADTTDAISNSSEDDTVVSVECNQDVSDKRRRDRLEGSAVSHDKKLKSSFVESRCAQEGTPQQRRRNSSQRRVSTFGMPTLPAGMLDFLQEMNEMRSRLEPEINVGHPSLRFPVPEIYSLDNFDEEMPDVRNLELHRTRERSSRPRTVWDLPDVPAAATLPDPDAFIDPESGGLAYSSCCEAAEFEAGSLFPAENLINIDSNNYHPLAINESSNVNNCNETSENQNRDSNNMCSTDRSDSTLNNDAIINQSGTRNRDHLFEVQNITQEFSHVSIAGSKLLNNSVIPEVSANPVLLSENLLESISTVRSNSLMCTSLANNSSATNADNSLLTTCRNLHSDSTPPFATSTNYENNSDRSASRNVESQLSEAGLQSVRGIARSPDDFVSPSVVMPHLHPLSALDVSDDSQTDQDSESGLSLRSVYYNSMISTTELGSTQACAGSYGRLENNTAADIYGAVSDFVGDEAVFNQPEGDSFSPTDILRNSSRQRQVDPTTLGRLMELHNIAIHTQRNLDADRTFGELQAPNFIINPLPNGIISDDDDNLSSSSVFEDLDSFLL